MFSLGNKKPIGMIVFFMTTLSNISSNKHNFITACPGVAKYDNITFSICENLDKNYK